MRIQKIGSVSYIHLEDIPEGLEFDPYPLLRDPQWVILTAQLRSLLAALKAPLELPKDPHVWVIDLRTRAHAVARWLLSQELQDPMMAAQKRWEVLLTKLPKDYTEFLEIQPEDPVSIILADDFPDNFPGFDRAVYWRHLYYPEYKGGRKPKPDTWDITTHAVMRAAESLHIPVLRDPYFEADDVMALFHRKKTQWGLRSLCIHTLDTDLLQLVEDGAPRTLWYNTMISNRLRDEAATRAYWLKTQKRAIESPRDIVDIKSRYGDRSDNLPPNSPRGLIDLLEPFEVLDQDFSWAPKITRTLAEWNQLNDQATMRCLLGDIPIDF